MRSIPLGAGLGGRRPPASRSSARWQHGAAKTSRPTVLPKRAGDSKWKTSESPVGDRTTTPPRWVARSVSGSAAAVTARRIPLPDDVVNALNRRCIVAYTGQSRISANTITAVMDGYRSREQRVLGSLDRLRDLAGQMVTALEAGDLDALGHLVGEHWVHQRALHPAIPTPLIDTVLADAKAAGALGGKALGASGGGCVLAIAAEGREEDVRRAMAGMRSRSCARVA